jgi:hypothetical protein
MKTYPQIKVGRKVFQPKKGDYILDNGSCKQFCTGDGRGLFFKAWTEYRNVVLPKNAIKLINLSEMRKVIKPNGFQYYFFD